MSNLLVLVGLHYVLNFPSYILRELRVNVELLDHFTSNSLRRIALDLESESQLVLFPLSPWQVDCHLYLKTVTYLLHEISLAHV